MFTKGCNLQCGWCHNADMVEGEMPDLDPREILDYVAGTQHRSLVICGGEPTQQTGLVDFMREAKRMGISVKLDTNGSNPRMLENILEERLCDYIAMDVKCALDRYQQVAGKALRPRLLRKTIALIKKSGIPHHFRTTVVPDLVDIEDLAAVKAETGEAPLVQKFRCSSGCIDPKYAQHREHSDEEFAELCERAADL